MATVPRLDELADVHGPLLFDLRDVSFIDSCGIAAFVRLYRRCEDDGCSFLIEACSPQVERLLRIVGLYDILTEDGVGHGPDLQLPAPEEGPEAMATG
jgi:anti-anti-sigma factor